MLGVLSLVFWALMIIVTLKYVVLIMRADNDGEGGIMALIALVAATLPMRSRRQLRRSVALGIFGAALFYGDGMITPAISVLSAVEGLEVADAAASTHYVVPIALVDPARRCSRSSASAPARSARCSGRSWCVWFVALAVLGLADIVDTPADPARAVNPTTRSQFFVDARRHRRSSSLGAVVLR